MAQTVDFEIATNEDWRDAIAVSQLGVPANPSSWLAARMQVRLRAGAPSVALDLSIANGRLITSDTTIATNVPMATVSRLSPGTYVHDLVVTAADGGTYRLFGGTLTVVQGVTR